ncbi:hypothetical protein [Brevundimonas sp. FT23028]|uniref:hypothetical protein n=1 Tax=Brevundimonas sp. FT23028 TaxID=3393748 RepID=UPI003B58A8CC
MKAVLGYLHKTVRIAIGAVGAIAFLIAGGMGIVVAFGQLASKLSGSTFGSEANDAVAYLLVAFFGGLAYLLSSIDHRLEQKREAAG